MNDRLAVTMCVYRRPELLASTLKMLGEQTHQNFDLFIWNNGLEDRIVRHLTEGIKYPVHVFGVGKNVGTWAKAILGQTVYFVGGYERVLSIDDDQMFEPEALNIYVRESTNNFGCLVTSLAYNLYRKPYRDRMAVNRGDIAEYGLTGGMIVPSVFYCGLAPQQIPDSLRKTYAYDLWISYRASLTGWVIVRSAVEPSFIDDGKDSSLEGGSMRKKHEALEYLRGLGWKV